MREARKAIRFPLGVSVAFCWKSENGTDRDGKGYSRDISERGVFVVAEDCPPPGVKIGLSISLPDLSDLAQALRLQIEGRVLRVDQGRPGSGTCGFAVLSEQVVLKQVDWTLN